MNFKTLHQIFKSNNGKTGPFFYEFTLTGGWVTNGKQIPELLHSWHL